MRQFLQLTRQRKNERVLIPVDKIISITESRYEGTEETYTAIHLDTPSPNANDLLLIVVSETFDRVKTMLNQQ